MLKYLSSYFPSKYEPSRGNYDIKYGKKCLVLAYAFFFGNIGLLWQLIVYHGVSIPLWVGIIQVAMMLVAILFANDVTWAWAEIVDNRMVMRRALNVMKRGRDRDKAEYDRIKKALEDSVKIP